jgi:hypothetical protein
MKQRTWIVRRSRVQTTDAQLRWDRAYQCLVHWSTISLDNRCSNPKAEVTLIRFRRVSLGWS